jgi:hypothetical protein
MSRYPGGTASSSTAGVDDCRRVGATEPATAALVKLHTPEPNVKTDALLGTDSTAGAWSTTTSTTAGVGDGSGADTKMNAWWAATSLTAGVGE